MEFDQWIKERNYICPICEQGTMSLDTSYCSIGTFYKKDIEIKCQEWKCNHCGDSVLDDLSEYVSDKAFIALREFMAKRSEKL